DAFTRYLHDGGRAVVPKRLLPVEEALRCVRAAGGVASWAHPPERCGGAELRALRNLGLAAVEAGYPGFRPARVRPVRAWARGRGAGAGGDGRQRLPGARERRPQRRRPQCVAAGAGGAARAGPRGKRTMMVVYAVRATFEDAAVAEEWLRWLGAGHVAAVLA